MRSTSVSRRLRVRIHSLHGLAALLLSLGGDRLRHACLLAVLWLSRARNAAAILIVLHYHLLLQEVLQ